MIAIRNCTLVKLSLVLTALFMLSGCFATATPHGAPPMTKRSGPIPTAALLPVGNTNDWAVAAFATQHIQRTLQDRNVFTFIDSKKVDRVVSASGVDMTKMFGLTDSEYKAIATELGVDFILQPFISIRKSLKFNGWRKDVDIFLRLHSGSTGEKVDSWRSMTDFAWAESSTERDAQKMAESAANHICAKMLESRTF